MLLAVLRLESRLSIDCLHPLTLFQAETVEVKQMWVKELRELIQQFQFGILRPRGKIYSMQTITRLNGDPFAPYCYLERVFVFSFCKCFVCGKHYCMLLTAHKIDEMDLFNRMLL